MPTIQPKPLIVTAAGWVALSVCAGLAYGQAPGKPVSHPPGTAARQAAPAAGTLSAADAAVLEQRFTEEVWPLLDRATGGCVACHNSENASQLHFLPDGPGANFKRLLARSFFEPENPAGLLARVTSPVQEQRMPPHPMKPWEDADVEKLRVFVNDVYEKSHRSGTRADELFPAELLDPYTGKRVSGGPDNTFLTYRQLKGKIKTVFGDDWRRAERDLFQENVAQFGGADFIKRFDESSKASATFLSALDALSRDVASKAYLASTGPFAGRAGNLPSPAALKAPTPAYRAEIARLYRKLLYRNPTETEVRQAFGFIRSIYAAGTKVASEESTLDLELEVADDAGQKVVRAVRLRAGNDPLGVYQELIDQTAAAEGNQARKKLDRAFTFKPDSPTQRFVLRNEATSGNVSLAAIELRGPLPEATVKRIDVTDPSVSVQGAWRSVEQGGFASYEDGNDDKGSSRIEIPVRVERPGKYEVSVVFRKPGDAQPGRGRRRAPVENAAAVPVEVYSHDPAVLANLPAPPVPPKGEAHFIVDQTVDTIEYWDLKTSFRFGSGPDQGVEYNNLGTQRPVVADSVQFVPLAPDGKTFVLDDPLAEGGWPEYPRQNFRAFNQVGRTALWDGGGEKKPMRLLYRPSKSTDWKPEGYYAVNVGFPGKANNETRAPIVVRAQESTPIIQMSAPLAAEVGAAVTLDASTSYNLQGTPLKFTWRQVGGPKVVFPDAHAPKVTFQAAAMSPQQAAWEGLCRALMKHPDFLFTRPRSLASVADKTDRRRLQLVKIAQDLVARPPTAAEIRQLEAGAPLSKLIDGYLGSQEFRDFYFHRVRLVLESRGGPDDDEPARLWSYVAFNDRPFKEILTADYTVDEQLRKQSRPAYHGKTGLLTMKGFIDGKPGLPHFNYAAIVTEKFLGYVYEVPPSIVMMREGITAVSTTSPTSACYSCHKILTPLAYQRMAWTDAGEYRPQEDGKPVDDTDRALVPSYPFRGKGMEAFALQAVNKERFIRTMLQTHFVWYFGREMRHEQDERGLYKRLWDNAHASDFSIRSMLKALMTSPQYLAAAAPAPARKTAAKPTIRRPVRGRR